jgi:hypothetical protein
MLTALNSGDRTVVSDDIAPTPRSHNVLGALDAVSHDLHRL